MCENAKAASEPFVPETLTFRRCQRGFVLREADYTRDRLFEPTYAFDKIEDLAKWLIDTYGEPKPAPRRGRRKS